MEIPGQPGTYKTLNRLPIILLIRPRQERDILETPNTYDVDLLDNYWENVSPTIRKLSVYEKYYLSYFSNQQHNSPEPLLIHDPEHAITFRIRSKFAQEKANSYVKYTHNYLKGGMWRLASRPILS